MRPRFNLEFHPTYMSTTMEDQQLRLLLYIICSCRTLRKTLNTVKMRYYNFTR